jgi:hypothetical protein
MPVGRAPGPSVIEMQRGIGKCWWGERHRPLTTEHPSTMRLAEPPNPVDWLRSA